MSAPKRGEFPFPLSDGNREAPAVTWIRNNSNYLNFSGAINVLQALATYVRGVIGNLIILSPIFILLGTVLGLAHFYMLDHPFVVTRWTTVLALILAVGFFAFHSSDSSFSETSKLTGILAMLLLIIAVIEASPFVIEYFRGSTYFDVFGLKEAASLVVSLATGAGVIAKYLPEHKQRRRGIMLFVLAVFGFVLAWLVLLLVANYVCYGLPPHDYMILYPVISIAAFLGCVGLYIVKSPVLDRVDRTVGLVVLFTIVILLFAFRSIVFTGFIVSYSDAAGQHVSTITHPLKQLVDGATESLGEKKESNKEEHDSEEQEQLSDIGKELAKTLRGLKLRIQGLELQATAKDALQFEAEHPAYQLGAPDVARPFPLKPEYFQSCAVFLENTQRSLGSLDQINRANLLMRLSDHARRVLRARICENAQADSKDGAQKGQRARDISNDQEVGKDGFHRGLLRKQIAVFATQRFVESKLQADSLSTTPMWLDDDPGNDVDAYLSDKDMRNFLKSLRVNSVHHSSYDRLTTGGIAKENLLKNRKFFEQPIEEDIMQWRLYIYVRAVLNRLAIDDARRYLERLKASEKKNKEFIEKKINDLNRDQDNRQSKDEATEQDENSEHDVEAKLELAEKKKERLDRLYCKESMQHLTSIVNARDPRFSTDLFRAAVVGTNVARSEQMIAFLQTLPIRTKRNEEQVEEIRKFARDALLEIAISDSQSLDRRHAAVQILGEAYDPQVPPLSMILGEVESDKLETAFQMRGHDPGSDFDKEQLYSLIARSFVIGDHTQAEYVMRRMVFGKYGNLEGLDSMNQDLYSYTLIPKLLLLLPLLVCLTFISVGFIGANSTSIHGYYRNRLANVFKLNEGVHHEKLSAEDSKDKATTKLSELSDREYGSHAPYHLINAAINMSISGEKEIRSRNADFFLFSKLFVGGKYTGYIPTKQFEEIAPELTVGGAMAISGAAASSNMGKYSNGVLNFFLCLLNIRLGYWLPNPYVARKGSTLTFEEVFVRELLDIKKRRHLEECDARGMQYSATTNRLKQVDKELLQQKTEPVESRKERTDEASKRRKKLSVSENSVPTVENELVGLALSGGGIRSAAFNLGILQHLHFCAFFREVDILSTVSGGGYIGTAVSTFMRRNTREALEDPVVKDEEDEGKENWTMLAGQPATKLGRVIRQIYYRVFWMPKSWLLLREMFSGVNHRSRCVNISDGGHIENLGLYELLRRRCKLIVVGDGEADSEGVFDGLASATRMAEIDMGVKIFFPHGSLDFARKKKNWDKCNPDESSNPPTNEDGEPLETKERCKHFALGRIDYPARNDKEHKETGYIIYLKSSFRGNEDLLLRNYKQENKEFPHESTADQIFDESQFEAYRRLGELVSKEAFDFLTAGEQGGKKENLKAYYFRVCAELQRRFE